MSDVRPAAQWPKGQAALAASAPAMQELFLREFSTDLYKLNDEGPADVVLAEFSAGLYRLNDDLTVANQLRFFRIGTTRIIIRGPDMAWITTGTVELPSLGANGAATAGASRAMLANLGGQAQIWGTGPDASIDGRITVVLGRSDLSNSTEVLDIRKTRLALAMQGGEMQLWSLGPDPSTGGTMLFIVGRSDLSNSLTWLSVAANGKATFAAPVAMSALPTSNPGGSGNLWNDGGIVKIT